MVDLRPRSQVENQELIRKSETRALNNAPDMSPRGPADVQGNTPSLGAIGTPNPDESAKINKLSEDLKVPKNVVAEDPQGFEWQFEDEKFQNTLKFFPITKDFIQRNDAVASTHDDVETLGTLELLSNSFQKGQLLHDLGKAGSRQRAHENPTTNAQIEEITNKIHNLGDDPEGVMSAFTGAAEIVGQNYNTIAGPNFTAGVIGGGAIGAAMGAAGGPFAPATVPAGALVGAAAGATSALFYEAYVVEGGLAYTEMREEGIEKSTAEWLSYVVGTINAGLELAGLTLVGAPLAKGMKALVKDQIRKELVDKASVRLAGTFAKNYSTAIAGETVTEMAQEVVNIAAEEWGKALNDLPSNFTTEEATDRVAGIGWKVLKSMTVLGLPGAGVSTLGDARNIHRAKKNKKVLDEVVETIKNGKLEIRDPDLAAAHTTEILEKAGHAEVFIPGDRLQEWAQRDPQLITNLGVADKIEEAIIIGGDVKISADKFSRHILRHDRYNEIAPHIRMDEQGLTEAEALALEEAGILEDVSAIPFDEEAVAADIEQTTQQLQQPESPVEIAEFEAGLNGIFRSADEAGMTETQYEKYLKGIEAKNQQAENKQKDKELKQQQRELTKEWKAEEEKTRAEITEETNNLPVYRAVNDIQQDRLDRSQVEAIAEAEGFTLADLPTQDKGRTIFTKKNETGIDIDTYAQLHEYADGREMLLDMATTLPQSEAIASNTQRIMLERHGNILEQKQAIIEARKTIHEVDYSNVLATEMNSLRTLRGLKQLTPSILKKAAKQRVGEIAIRDITPSKFEAAARRNGKQAGIALRRGDIGAAADFKFKQLMNYNMAVEAKSITAQVEKRASEMRKWRKQKKKGQKVPSPHQEAIREVLSLINLDPSLSKKKRDALNKVANHPDAPNIPAHYRDSGYITHYRDMPLNDFNTAYQTVKDIRKKGLEENKLRRKEEERNVEEIAGTIAELVETNLPKINTTDEKTRWDRTKKFGSELLSLTFNMDTLLREIDGFESLGAAYEAIKGRYDRALSGGYLPGKMGYLKRQQKVAKEVLDLYRTAYTQGEMKAFNDKLTVPGISRRMSKHEVVAVLLNSGNQENINAMLESGQFTEQQLQAIWDFADARDLNFVQSVWDYLDGFWKEVKQTEERRRNYTPQRVEPRELVAKNGTLKGGYFPLRYDKEQSAIVTPTDIETLQKTAQYGKFVTQMTRRGHTDARKANVKKPVLLDAFVLHSHIDQVIYDLEVGDAVSDMWKVATHPKVKEAFRNAGQSHRFEMIELWLRDVTTQELRSNNRLERSLRWIRTGFTVSKLAWNVGVSALQILGTLQSSVKVGSGNMFWGLNTMLSPSRAGISKAALGRNVFEWVQNESPFMAARAATFHKDITDTQTLLKDSKFARIAPGNSAEFLITSYFWGIRTIQGVTDHITWLAAMRQGIKDLEMDFETAKRHADRMVSQSQASGIFGERTPFERGSIRTDLAQTEQVRVWTAFMSYFAAKWNITVERTKQTGKAVNERGITDPRSFLEVMKWAKDMALIYTTEALLAALIQGRFPDEDEDIPAFATEETALTMMNSIPLVREVSSIAGGFQGGGVLGAFAADVVQAGAQIKQFEFDYSLVTQVNDVFGTLFHYPSGQMNKFLRTLGKVEDNEDIRAMDWIMGPKFEE